MPIRPDGKPTLRTWKEQYFNVNPLVLEPRVYRDVLFRGCVITKCAGATLLSCCLTDSKFAIDKVEDMLDFTMGLDCAHFSDVEFSEKVFDYLVLLLVRSKGNTKKRLALIEALGGKKQVSRLLNAAYEGNNWWQR